MSFATTVVSNIGIVLAPVLFAASVYMTLGRIVLLSGQPDLSIVRPRWLTKLFVLGDVISFLIQAYGRTPYQPTYTTALLMTIGVSQLTQDDPETVDTGRTIMVVGLWIQIFFFGFFVVTALLFWFRMSRLSHRPTEERPWKKHLVILVVASTLILIRCVFRVIEYMQGPSGELISNEIYTYVFDAALMLTMMLIFHFFHPSEISCWLYGTKMISFLAVTNAKGLHVEQPREFVGLMERV